MNGCVTAIRGTISSGADAIAIQANGQLVPAGVGSDDAQGPHGTERRSEMALVRDYTDGTLDDGASPAAVAPRGPHRLDSPDPWDELPLTKRLRSF